MPGDTTERVGVNAVEAIFLKDFKWAFREQNVSDYGIDAHVEIADENGPTGKLIALQIKTGSSYFKKRGADYVFYGDLRHLAYWTNHSLPVFIILHDPTTKVTLWQKVERHLATTTDTGWSITVPAGNSLDAKAKQYLQEGIANDDESRRRFQFAIDLDTMKLFEQHEEIYLKMDRWVNKSLSVRGVEIYFDDKDKQKSDISLGYWAAGYSNHDCMQRWFPWLNYEYAEPIENHAGEVDSHVYLVSLNKHAKAFLELEEFFRSGDPTQDEPEPPEGEDYDQIWGWRHMEDE